MADTGHIERAEKEAIELGEKIDNLVSFMDSDLFDNLPEHDAFALVQQLSFMQGYLNTLTYRVNRLNK